MGYCPEATRDMGNFCVEVRRESFWLRGVDVFTGDHGVELMLADIPKLRAALDQVERYLNGERA